MLGYYISSNKKKTDANLKTVAIGKHSTVLSGNTDTHKMSAMFKGPGKRRGHQDECCHCVFCSGRKMFFFVFLCPRNIGQWY